MLKAELDRPQRRHLRGGDRDPYLSAQIAQRLLGLPNHFNAKPAAVTEVHLTAAKQELLEVENRLQSFLETNRDIWTSPLLRFRQDSLQREVDIRQAVVSALAQNYEQPRIDEVRDIRYQNRRGTGRACCARPANAPAQARAGPGGGALLGALLAFFLTFVRASRTDTAGELDEFRRAAGHDIRRPCRLLGGGRGLNRSAR